MQTRGFWKFNNFTFRDKILGPAEGGSIWQYCPIVAQLDPSVATHYYDDFIYLASTKATPADDGWTIVEDDGAGGTYAVGDGVGGIYTQYCDGDENDESYLISANEVWKFAAGKSVWFEAKVGIIEGATNEAGMIVGLMDAAGAGAIADGRAGPAASYDGAVFFKATGALSYYFETSNAGTQSTSSALGTHTSGTAIKYGFWCKTESTSDTTATVYPFINGAIGTAQTLTLSGLEEMHAIVGIKGGANAAEEAFFIDYIKIIQIR
jgi:hypothetical protein